MKKINYFIVLFIVFLFTALAFCFIEYEVLLEENLEADHEKKTKDVIENNTVIEDMPEIADIITGEGYAIVLCKDGSVWSQEKVQNTNQKIEWDINLFKKNRGIKQNY